MISRWNLIKLFIISFVLTSITNFPSGFTNSSVNTAVRELRSFINESYYRRGYDFNTATQDLIYSAILNCWFVVQVLGSMIAPFITDKYGRKFAYLVSTTIMTAGSALQFLATFIHSPELLMLGRLSAGLMSPLSDAALILYLQETSPVQFRGSFSFLGEIGYCFMCLLGMVLGMRSVLGDSLRNLLGFSILPGVVAVFFLFFMPETPKFLMISRRNRIKALASLRFFQGDKKENDRILDDFMREGTLDEHKKRSSIREVLSTWHLRFAVFLACAVLVLTLSFYPILQSSTRFFEHIEIESELAEFSSTGLMVAFTLACMFGSLFIDRYPRRYLVLISGALATFFLTLFIVFSGISHLHWKLKYFALGALFLYAITFGMVLGPVSWFVAPELVSQRHRSTLFCLCYGINNVLIAITNFATSSLYSSFGALVMGPLLVVPSIISLVIIYLYLPETLGKETHEIVRAIRYRRKHTSNDDSRSSSDSEEGQNNAMI
ncbi:Solute carrier family 2, facilitated glucose transporter member 1 [Aphelenchoides besseyi]|nr:Solute carrier family 2, facilitated glucose transporter member 1 [Aphelenchoides besseyi]KAI6193662.1 Solute carrier family 2, facilitated glucose transporter member 1 [Aphelenchoides besseyi]